MTFKEILCAAALITTFSLVPCASAKSPVRGPFPFDPISGSSGTNFDAPWILPEGYEQSILSDELDLNIYPESPDLNDMNVQNETGKKAGRYLYRTHEVRPGAPGSGKPGGAVSVLDLATGAAKVLVQRDDWEALDGIEWTQWGTLLFAEEIVNNARPDPDFPNATSGLLYEVVFDKKDPSVAAGVFARPALGSLAHEGIVADGNRDIYVIDERNGGGIYKFVADREGDLSSGQLFALKVADAATRVGAAEWVPLDRDQVQISARTASNAVGATGWARPEDLELIGRTLYAAVTGEDLVLAIDLEGSQPSVSNFVKAGVNVPEEGTTKVGADTGFNSPDNLAVDKAGNLYIAEDNVPSDIWVATPDRDGDGQSDSVNLFASLTDPGAESTGIYFGKDAGILFVNIQHSASGNDKTMLIYRAGDKSVRKIGGK